MPRRTRRRRTIPRRTTKSNRRVATLVGNETRASRHEKTPRRGVTLQIVSTIASRVSCLHASVPIARIVAPPVGPTARRGAGSHCGAAAEGYNRAQRADPWGAAPMPDSAVRPPVDDLVFHLFARPVHPEFFDTLALRRVERPADTLTVRITPTGHAITFQTAKWSLTEVTAAARQPLPANGRLMRQRVRPGEHRAACRPRPNLSYMMLSHVETHAARGVRPGPPGDLGRRPHGAACCTASPRTTASASRRSDSCRSKPGRAG